MALESLTGLTNYKFGDIDENEIHKKATGNFYNQMRLSLPPFDNPAQKLKELRQQGLKIHFDHGTTTLGFRFKNGVILAVDSRATGGQFIGSQSMKKIVEINDYLLGTLAGGAADCVYWDRVLAKQCRMFELRNHERISVAAASKLMTNMVYNYKGMGLSMGMMIAGWDKRGPSLYYVSDDGTRTSGKVFSVGSGSIYAFGVLDTSYKWDLEDNEAYDIAQRSIYHATYRDAYSGGIIRVYHIKETGWVNISEVDCKQLHYQYQNEKGFGKQITILLGMEENYKKKGYCQRSYHPSAPKTNGSEKPRIYLSSVD